MKRNKKGQFAKIRFDRFCLDCGKSISGYKAKRCAKCAVTERMKHYSMPIHNKPHTKSVRKRISITKGGNGITKPARNMNSARYKKWREAVFKRDNYTCQKCDKTNCYLEAHHIKSWTKYRKLRYVISNGQTLCYKCHQLTKQFYGNQYTKK